MADRSLEGALARRGRALPLVGLAMAGLLAAGALQPTSAGYTDRVHATSAPIASEVVPAFQPGLSQHSRMHQTGSGLSNGGRVVVWGERTGGISGNGSVDLAESPVEVPGLPIIRQVTGSSRNLNAIDETGQLWGWGTFSDRDGTDRLFPSTSPQRIRIGTSSSGSGALLDQIMTVSSTEFAGAGIRADGTVWHWGRADGYGGNAGSGASRVLGLPDPSLPGNRPTAVRGASTNFFLLLENGDVYYWGGTTANSLPAGYGGVGSTAALITSLAPWARHNVGEGGAYIVAVDGGRNMGAALLSDGRVLSWGSSAQRIGGRSTASTAAGQPGIVPGLTDIRSMRFSFTGALFLDGQAVLHGYGAPDDDGLLPNAAGVIDQTVTQMSAGQDFYLWQRADGTFWGRGYNPDGAIGQPAGTQTANRQISWDLSAMGGAG